MQGFEHNSSKQLRTPDSKLGNMEIKEKENIGFDETRKEKPLFLGVFVFMSIKMSSQFISNMHMIILVVLCDILFLNT